MNNRPRWETDSVSKTESVWMSRISIFYLRPETSAALDERTNIVTRRSAKGVEKGQVS